MMAVYPGRNLFVYCFSITIEDEADSTMLYISPESSKVKSFLTFWVIARNVPLKVYRPLDANLDIIAWSGVDRIALSIQNWCC